MSIISNMHTATVYESKGPNKTKAFEGQRLVITIAKADKDGNYGQHLQQTMATSIPHLGLSDVDFTNQRVQLACTEYFQTIQNKIVADNLKSGHKEVSTESLGQDKILAFLESETNGDKWDSARIAVWFNESLAESIATALLSKGFPESKLEETLGKYSKLLSESLGSKALIGKRKALEIQKALKLAGENDAIAKRFTARIDKILNDESVTEALGL